MLTEFGPGLWLANGSVVEVLGFRYPTRTAVIRLENGDLVIWSPIALTEGLRSGIEALGRPTHLIAPNALHHLFIGEWRAAYPEARAYAAPGLARKRKDIAFDAELGDQPEPAWAGEIEQVAMRGCVITTEIVFFHRPSGTVLFTDLLQHFPEGWFSGWRAWVARLDRMTAPEPSVPRKFRLAFTDRRAARDSLDRILQWPIETVVMAHGAPVPKDGAALVRRAFGWLSR